MASYTNQKDHFTSDSGLWTDKTTSVSISFAGGKKVFDKTADTWVSGHHFGALKAFTKGDGIIYKFVWDELNATDTYHVVALSTGVTPDYSGSGYGIYWYPDANVKAHGQDGGGIASVRSNPAGTPAQGDIILVRFSCALATGFVDVDIKGGPYADWTNCVAGGADISSGNAGGYGPWKLYHGMYSANTIFTESNPLVLLFTLGKFYDIPLMSITVVV